MQQKRICISIGRWLTPLLTNGPAAKGEANSMVKAVRWGHCSLTRGGVLFAWLLAGSQVRPVIRQLNRMRPHWMPLVQMRFAALGRPCAFRRILPFDADEGRGEASGRASGARPQAWQLIRDLAVDASPTLTKMVSSAYYFQSRSLPCSSPREPCQSGSRPTPASTTTGAHQSCRRQTL